MAQVPLERALSLALVAAVVTAARGLRAGDAPPSADRVRAAADEYDAGRRAYLAGEYTSAAVHFENAFVDSPRVESLRSALRARRAAGDCARSATLAALALARYGENAPARTLAEDALAACAPRLHEVALTCRPDCSVAVDGRVATLQDAPSVRVFVDPGPHTLVVSFGGSADRALSIDGRAGDAESLRIEAAPPVARPPAPSPAVAPRSSVAAPAAPPSGPSPSSGGRPLSPAWFYAGAGLTAAGIAATVASGVDTLQNPGTAAVRAHCVGQGPTCSEYQRGVAAQTRTNVLIAVTATVGIATAAAGLFFTDFRPAGAASRPRPSGGGPLPPPPVTAVTGGPAMGIDGIAPVLDGSALGLVAWGRVRLF